ncbi:hypothetical protein K501DRAFT_305247 [Backusella circina FSU 941]|nr:hypothetical protein K501DRAFT_305247 [Backusella circina FSU 941]
MLTFHLTSSLEHLHKSLESSLGSSRKTVRPTKKHEDKKSIEQIWPQEWISYQFQKIQNSNKENHLQFRSTPEYCVKTNTPADHAKYFTQLKRELIDSRLNDFTSKSKHVSEWLDQSMPTLSVFVKEILHWIPGIDTTVTPIIESGIEQQYRFWNDKITSFYGGIYNEMSHSLNLLLAVVGVRSLKSRYGDVFNVYKRIYQRSLDFKQLVDYLHKVHQQRNQLNNYMAKVHDTIQTIEYHLQSSEIDVPFCKTIQEKISALVTDDFKQISYPDPPRYEKYIYNVNYNSYMHVSSHKIQLIEIDQRLTQLLKNIKNKKDDNIL